MTVIIILLPMGSGSISFLLPDDSVWQIAPTGGKEQKRKRGGGLSELAGRWSVGPSGEKGEERYLGSDGREMCRQPQRLVTVG